ncbi:MAG: hypothetical protein WCE64_11090, partial [Bacteroidales bacterium]
MKNRTLLLAVFLLSGLALDAQTGGGNRNGQVSFVSTNNVYVRFGNTAGISVNDTLYTSDEGKLVPALVVTNLSSTSCLCTPIQGQNIPVGHVILAKPRISAAVPEIKTLADVRNETPLPSLKEEPVSHTPEDTSMKVGVPLRKKQMINGSISAASYSDFSNSPGADIQRFRYTLSLNAMHIGNSRYSAESYISFRHKAGAWSEIKNDVFNGLKIYSLALKYDIDSTAHLKLGRQINPRLSSIGSFDGVVFEKSVKSLSFGLAGGFRPDYTDWGFDPKLFQYGAYISHDISSSRSYSSTSLAFMEQLNSWKTDRRFLYFQHSGSIHKLSLFGSFEVDIFKLLNNKPVTSPDLTSLYFYASYRIMKNFSVGASYDARKNPVYYETFKTLTDTLRENARRQSYRLHANVRITPHLNLGIQSSYRFLKTDPKKSTDLSGYLTYSGSSADYFSATLSGGYIETSYIKGPSAGISVQRS